VDAKANGHVQRACTQSERDEVAPLLALCHGLSHANDPEPEQCCPREGGVVPDKDAETKQHTTECCRSEPQKPSVDRRWSGGA
jgi:hypothetical protein